MHATQATLALAALLALAAAALRALPLIRGGARRAGPRAASACALCAMLAAWLYGGKWYTAEKGEAGADAGIGIAAVYVEYDTNADASAVTVWYTSGVVSASTPVLWRDGATNNWSEAVKADVTAGSDGASNYLSFVSSGRLDLPGRSWWVGPSPPGVVIQTRGIEVVDFLATSKLVDLAWTCDDPRAVTFEVQRRRAGTDLWETVAVTAATNYTWRGFSVGEDWEWRIMATYTEGEE